MKSGIVAESRSSNSRGIDLVSAKFDQTTDVFPVMTPIQQKTNYPNLMILQGTTLDEAYVLGQCLGADERTMIFKAQVKAGAPGTAIVKIYSAELSAAEEQI